MTARTAAGAARPSSHRHRRSSCCWRAASARCRSGRCAAMARGGIYDQIGGGFSRYAVDATWTVPHFEKMLYDNALLARAYLHGWQVSGEDRLRRVCCETLDWALREMRGPGGRLLLGARRRLRGRRGEVLRLDGRPAARRPRPSAGRRGDRLLRGDRARELRARAQRARGSRPRARALARDPLQALRRARAARAARARRQAAHRLERADDLGAGRRRRRARARGLRRGGGRLRCRSCSTSSATPTVTCSGPGRTGRRRWALTSRTTRSCSRR